MDTEVKAFVPKEWAEKLKNAGVRHQKFIYKCYARAVQDPDSPEAQLIKECAEEIFECPKCSSKVNRVQWDVRLGGMCKLCYRDFVHSQKQELGMAYTVRRAGQDSTRRWLHELDKSKAKKIY